MPTPPPTLLGGAAGYGALLSPRLFALVLTGMFPISVTVIFLTGLWVVGRLALRLLYFLAQITVWPGTNWKSYGARSGAWAVVSGATDGLGREFALQLARAGFNIALVSRNPEKLATVAREVEAQREGTQTVVHAIDFASADEAAYAALEKALAALPDVGVLVNNVGTNHALPTPFSSASPSELSAIVAVNCTAAVRLTRALLPALAASAKERKRRALVLSLGSFSGGLLPTPLLATYAGTKAFLTTWSAALAPEVAPARVDVRVLHAYYIATPMFKVRRPSMLVPSATAWVRAALAGALARGGAVDEPGVGVPYWAHAVIYFAVRTLGIEGLATRLGHKGATQAREKILRRQAKNQ